MTAWYVSCTAWTVMVETDAAMIITRAAPIVRKFTGQPLHQLTRWAGKWQPVRVERLRDRPPSPAPRPEGGRG